MPRHRTPPENQGFMQRSSKVLLQLTQIAIVWQIFRPTIFNWFIGMRICWPTHLQPRDTALPPFMTTFSALTEKHADRTACNLKAHCDCVIGFCYAGKGEMR